MYVTVKLDIVIDDAQVKTNLTTEKMEDVDPSVFVEICKEIEIFKRRVQSKVQKLQTNGGAAAEPEANTSTDAPEAQPAAEE